MFSSWSSRIWGQKTRVEKQRCCWWRLCNLLGCSEPFCRVPMGQQHPGLFAGQNWAMEPQESRSRALQWEALWAMPGGPACDLEPSQVLSVPVAGPVLTHTQYYLSLLLQIGSEQSLICQHRLPTLRCHQPPLLPCSGTCLSKM